MEKEQKIEIARSDRDFSYVNKLLTDDGWSVKFCVAQAVSTSRLFELNGNIVFVLERDKYVTAPTGRH